MRLHQQGHEQGYTLIEVLLVVAILVTVLTFSAPFFLSFHRTNELDVATNTLAQYLYQAQSQSRSQVHDCPWGVTIAGKQIVLFCGSSYASRDTAHDVTYVMPDYISVENNMEIVYSKLHGIPQTTGLFSLETSDRTQSVIIHAKGMVEY